MKKIFPDSFYNSITLLGGAVASISFGLIVFLAVLDALAKEQKPYMGIITFIVLPIILIIGLLLIAFGVMRERRRKKQGLVIDHRLPRIDLNDSKQRTAFVTISLAGLLLLGFSAFGSFKAYEYTDSDQFCGTVCHKVMHPEYTAYQYSPHARVGCVQCHIGPGAGWFVRSKFSGAYQVYSVLFNKYSRPIPTPIENLRPAQQTCEQCHWPKQFFSEKFLHNTYYLSDDKNSKWTLDLLVRIGGGNIEAGPTSGIHWHMNIENEVMYVATDSQRQVIPWVRAKDLDGKVTVYRSTDQPMSDSAAAQREMRRMDCIDCHNRPTHIYHPPARSVNHVMSLGWIDPELPGIKSLAVKALEQSYTSEMQAGEGIQQTIKEFYILNYPDIARDKQKDIDRAVEEVQKIYSRNYFPEMNVSWKRFNDNVGHLYYPGCFRCHDGKHVSGDGKVLSRDCNVCHTILSQQFEKKGLRMSLSGVEYQHPVDIGNAWKEMNCSDCHNVQ
ncbi:MAG: NapC/NirT family cytochrome c [Bacteroidota bacterium]